MNDTPAGVKACRGVFAARYSGGVRLLDMLFRKFGYDPEAHFPGGSHREGSDSGTVVNGAQPLFRLQAETGILTFASIVHKDHLRKQYAPNGEAASALRGKVG